MAKMRNPIPFPSEPFPDIAGRRFTMTKSNEEVENGNFGVGSCRFLLPAAKLWGGGPRPSGVVEGRRRRVIATPSALRAAISPSLLDREDHHVRSPVESGHSFSATMLFAIVHPEPHTPPPPVFELAL